MDVRDFWIEPSPERTISFILAFLFLGMIILGVHLSYRHRIRVRWETEFAKRLKAAGILGKPEEQILRELVEQYQITPPAQVLSSLQQYDEIASQEIFRLEKAVMPLGERIDRIEYLYSIRIQSFNEDPAIIGAEKLLPKEPTISLPGSPMAGPVQPLEIDPTTGPDLSALFSDTPEILAPPAQEEESTV